METIMKQDAPIEDTTTHIRKSKKIILNGLFKDFDLNKDGVLSKEELEKVIDFKQNIVFARFCHIIDTNKDGLIDSKEFNTGLHDLLFGGDEYARLKLIFKFYDFDEDGKISNNDIYETLSFLLDEDRLTPTQLISLSDHTILEFDKDGDLKLNFDEFKEAAVKNGWFNLIELGPK
eukprot:GAHX01000639.1.p1 GENE.GAHX01000639.1~~GAHX01000639.1.p1  ORF type:complete len:176 (-),score=48.36 GAHX01000639.1:26-553(-)